MEATFTTGQNNGIVMVAFFNRKTVTIGDQRYRKYTGGSVRPGTRCVCVRREAQVFIEKFLKISVPYEMLIETDRLINYETRNRIVSIVYIGDAMYDDELRSMFLIEATKKA